MKCKYCNAELNKDAQFCTSCGKDLSKFVRCIKCGELIDSKDQFCTNCGTEKIYIVEEENVYEEDQQKVKKTSKGKWILGIFLLLLLAAVGYFIYENMWPYGNSKVVELRPFTTEVSGENGELVSVANRTYRLIINNNDSGDAYAISVKLILNEKKDGINDVDLDDINIDDCELVILDQNGGEMQTLIIDRDDKVQLKKLLKSGIRDEKEVVFKGSYVSQESAESLLHNATSFKVKKFHVTTSIVASKTNKIQTNPSNIIDQQENCSQLESSNTTVGQVQSAEDMMISRARQIGSSGEMKVTLLWDFHADIDLHILQPNGKEIWYKSKSDASTGGMLDVDNRSGGRGAAENIYWQNPLRGQYKVAVKYYGKSKTTGEMESGDCSVIVFLPGKQPQTYKVRMSQKDEVTQICTINL